jgi:hypothetical protein
MICEYCQTEHGSEPCKQCGGPTKSPWWRRIFPERQSGFVRDRGQIIQRLKKLEHQSFHSPYSSDREAAAKKAHVLRWVIDSEVKL